MILGLLLPAALLAQADPAFEPYGVLGDNVTFFHAGNVLALAHFPDGSKLAASSDRPDLVVWDALSGAPLAAKAGFRAESLAVSPDGMSVVAGTSRGSVVTLAFPGLTTGKQLDSPGAGQVLLSRNARRAVAQNKDKLDFFDLETGKVASEAHRHPPGPFSLQLAISPDGETAASADVAGVVRVWKTSTRKILAAHQVAGDGNTIRVSFSADGKRLVVSTNRIPATILDATKPGEISTWPGYRELLETGNPGTFLGLSAEGLAVLDPATKAELARFDRPGPDALPPGALAPDGKSVAAVVGLQGILLLKLPGLTPTITLQGPAARIVGLSMSGKSDRVVAAADDGMLYLWDLASKALLRRIDGRFPPGPHLHHATRVRWTAGDAAIDGLGNFGFARWNPATGAKIQELKPPPGQSYLHLVPDGESVVVGAGPAGLQRQLPLKDHRVAAAYRGGSAAPPSFSADGTKVALRIDIDTVGVFDVAGGKLLRKTPLKSALYEPLLLSPDAEQLIVVGDAISVVLLKTGKELRRIERKDVTRRGSQAWAAALSPDGSLLAVGFTDPPTPQLWKLGDGTLLQPLAGPKSPIRCIEFSRDGRWLAASGWDRTVHVWSRKK